MEFDEEDEVVTEDWAAVAVAIKERRRELRMSQKRLGELADVSKPIVGEIENNKVERRRGVRTLEALSVALGWHPRHLAAVLAGLTPPLEDEPVPRSETDVPGRMSVLEHHMRKLFGEVKTANGQLEVLTTKVDIVSRCADLDEGNAGR